ncbi:hypothetical protein G6011_03506 [Alternaria panax]|uniref:Uncharacterized protein n=1 Tax=Alternaria panax TaxID=48097 RepID=A0AAD4IFH5_9PLEO|nr:hypothetical protein G6011_03506 [Alternaria panax]
MPHRGFPGPDQEASEMATARRKVSEEEGGVVLPPDSWTYLPDSYQAASKGAPLSNNDAADVPESMDLPDDAWYPDSFRLPDAEDKIESAKYGRGLCDFPSESGLDTADPPQRRFRFNLRGGEGSEPETNNPALVRTASEERREHIRRKRAEALATLQYHGETEKRERKRAFNCS